MLQIYGYDYAFLDNVTSLYIATKHCEIHIIIQNGPSFDYVWTCIKALSSILFHQRYTVEKHCEINQKMKLWNLMCLTMSEYVSKH